MFTDDDLFAERDQVAWLILASIVLYAVAILVGLVEGVFDSRLFDTVESFIFGCMLLFGTYPCLWLANVVFWISVFLYLGRRIMPFFVLALVTLALALVPTVEQNACSYIWKASCFSLAIAGIFDFSRHRLQHRSASKLDDDEVQTEVPQPRQPAFEKSNNVKHASVYCPGCQTLLEPGFISGFPTNAVVMTSWVAGNPKRGRGLNPQVVHVTPTECHPITVYRCPACGRLEFFAGRED